MYNMDEKYENMDDMDEKCENMDEKLNFIKY